MGKESVMVEGLSKYGFKANGVYYNWGKKTTQEDKDKVVPGAVYDMDIWVAESGKKYVNSVAGAGKPATNNVAVLEKPTAVPLASIVPTKGTPAPYVTRDFDKEARGKTKCAVFCAALQSPFAATLGSQKELVDFIAEMVELGVKTSFGD